MTKRTRVRWTAIFPPIGNISRFKYYKLYIGELFTINGIEFSKDDLVSYFTPEVGTWDDVFKVTKEAVIEEKEFKKKSIKTAVK